jgi:hypothetical protein
MSSGNMSYSAIDRGSIGRCNIYYHLNLSGGHLGGDERCTLLA